jgi:nucleoside-diphosphate-sugar epimerase
LLDGRPILVPGSGDCTFQEVYVEDVARMFVRLLDSPESVGKAYNIAAEEVLSLNEYLRALAALLGRNPDVVHIPQDAFEGLSISSSEAGDVFPFNVRRSSVFSLQLIKHDLGYRSTPWEEWMQETIAWWCAPGRCDSNGWSHRAEEIQHALQRTNAR